MPPNIPKGHGRANIYNSLEMAKLKDKAFAAKCNAATSLQAIYEYQGEELRNLTELHAIIRPLHIT